MKLRISYYNGDDRGQFEYHSQYSRKNAKGIMGEIMSMAYKRFGRNACYFEINGVDRVREDD